MILFMDNKTFITLHFVCSLHYMYTSIFAALQICLLHNIFQSEILRYLSDVTRQILLYQFRTSIKIQDDVGSLL